MASACSKISSCLSFKSFSAFLTYFALFAISTSFCLVASSWTRSFLVYLLLILYFLPALSLPLIFFFLFFIFLRFFSFSSISCSLYITSFEALSIVPISSGFIVIVYHGILSSNAFTSFSYLCYFEEKIFTSNLLDNI
jgi:hypothetical protein